MKAVIEGPKDAKFQAYRKRMDMKSDSDIDEPEQSDDEKLEDSDPMDHVEGKSERGDEDDMEGIEEA